MKTINTHKIANLLVRIREVNPSDSCYDIMRNAVIQKYGNNDQFSHYIGTDHLLVEALKSYLKTSKT